MYGSPAPYTRLFFLEFAILTRVGHIISSVPLLLFEVSLAIIPGKCPRELVLCDKRRIFAFLSDCGLELCMPLSCNRTDS